MSEEESLIHGFSMAKRNVTAITKKLELATKDLNAKEEDLSLTEIQKERLETLKTLNDLITEALSLANVASPEGKKGGRPDKIRYLQLAGSLLKTRDDILTRMEDAQLSKEVEKIEAQQIRISEKHK